MNLGDVVNNTEVASNPRVADDPKVINQSGTVNQEVTTDIDKPTNIDGPTTTNASATMINEPVWGGVVSSPEREMTDIGGAEDIKKGGTLNWGLTESPA